MAASIREGRTDILRPAPCRTLLVMNDVFASREIQQLLEGEGHAVIPTCTVGGAVEFLTSWDPQCVVIDLNLPDGNGVEILKQMRRNGSAVPAAVLCDDPDSVEAAAARAHQPVHSFRKPIDADAFSQWARDGQSVPLKHPAHRTTRRSA
jgi:CheY-like chemotaxis protein